MPSVQEIADIASRHLTRMADAMIAACVAWALETGQPLRMPGRPARGAPSSMERPAEDVPWRRMVERNSDTRWQHT